MEIKALWNNFHAQCLGLWGGGGGWGGGSGRVKVEGSFTLL